MGFFNSNDEAPSDPQPLAAPPEGEVLDDTLEAPEEPAEGAEGEEEEEVDPSDPTTEAGQISLPERVESAPVESAPVEVAAPKVELVDPKDEHDKRYQGDPEVPVAAIEHGEAVPAPQKVTEVVDNGGIKTHPPELMADVNAVRNVSI